MYKQTDKELLQEYNELMSNNFGTYYNEISPGTYVKEYVKGKEFKKGQEYLLETDTNVIKLTHAIYIGNGVFRGGDRHGKVHSVVSKVDTEPKNYQYTTLHSIKYIKQPPIKVYALDTLDTSPETGYTIWG